MQCYRCGANLKDKAMVCPKCGFIMKGAKKVEHVATLSFEERINNASAEELRALILSYRKSQQPKTLEPEEIMARRGKRWAMVAFISGIASLVGIVIPGFNTILAVIFFILAFIGFGNCAGQKGNLAFIGLIMTIVAVAGSWFYNEFAAPAIGKSMGLIKEVAKDGAEQAANSAV